MATLAHDLVELDPGADALVELDVPRRVAGMVGTDLSLAYGVERKDDDRLGIAFMVGHAAWNPPIEPVLDAWLEAYEPDKLAYDPDRPQPWQQNKALRKVDLRRAGEPAADAERELFPTLGMNRHDQLRVLLCDGADLLAWIGAYRRKPFTAAERHTLQAVVPMLRNRLLVERHFAEARRATTALNAVLEHVPGAAFVLSRGGRVEGANATARALLETEPERTRAMLAQVASETASPSPLGLVCERVEGGWLVIVPPRAAGVDVASRVHDLSRKAALTPRQASVFAVLAEGLSNRGIAATLGISVRTVEAHLDAVFDKLGVGSRSAALALLFDDAPAAAADR